MWSNSEWIFKKEENEIDILIKNVNKQQAIIIENKLDAKDSIQQFKKEGYKGQLERYFNETKDKGYLEEHIFVFFLTLNRPPTNLSLGKTLINKSNWRDCLYYGIEVRDWLEKCMLIIPKEKIILKNFILHYLNLINKMTNNDISKTERIELKENIAQNLDAAKFLINNFKHVKWHTIHEFWIELKKEMQNKGIENIEFYQVKSNNFENAITNIAHKNKNINHGLLFDFNIGIKAYISGLNTLTWGIEKEWFYFQSKFIDDISFVEFSNENTYRLIDKLNSKIAIESIVNEIIEKQKNYSQEIIS